MPTISIDSAAALGGPAARRRTARVLVGVEAVEHLAGEVGEARGLAAEVVGVLGQAELAEDHDAVLTQLLRHAGIDRREGVAQREVARRRVHALDVDQVLEQDRQPVRGAADVAVLALLVQQRGVLQCVVVELGHGVEAGPALVERGDARDVRARQFHRRQLPFVHQLDGRRPVERLQVQLCRLRRRGAHQCARERQDRAFHPVPSVVQLTRARRYSQARPRRIGPSVEGRIDRQSGLVQTSSAPSGGGVPGT